MRVCYAPRGRLIAGDVQAAWGADGLLVQVLDAPDCHLEWSRPLPAYLARVQAMMAEVGARLDGVPWWAVTQATNRNSGVAGWRQMWWDPADARQRERSVELFRGYCVRARAAGASGVVVDLEDYRAVFGGEKTAWVGPERAAMADVFAGGWAAAARDAVVPLGVMDRFGFAGRYEVYRRAVRALVHGQTGVLLWSEDWFGGSGYRYPDLRKMVQGLEPRQVGRGFRGRPGEGPEWRRHEVACAKAGFVSWFYPWG